MTELVSVIKRYPALCINKWSNRTDRPCGYRSDRSYRRNGTDRPFGNRPDRSDGPYGTNRSNRSYRRSRSCRSQRSYGSHRGYGSYRGHRCQGRNRSYGSHRPRRYGSYRSGGTVPRRRTRHSGICYKPWNRRSCDIRLRHPAAGKAGRICGRLGSLCRS